MGAVVTQERGQRRVGIGGDETADDGTVRVAPVSGRAGGGHVKGPGEHGGPGDDTVPVMIGRHEQWLTAEQVRKLTEETRGGEEPFAWKVSPGAIVTAEDLGGEA
jgi:hypothetical protein